MDNLKTIRAEQAQARSALALAELALADAKRQLDKAHLANDQLHAQLKRRTPGMRTVFVAEAITGRKKDVDDAFEAWAEAGLAKDRAMKLCCELALKLRKAKAKAELP